MKDVSGGTRYDQGISEEFQDVSKEFQILRSVSEGLSELQLVGGW